MPEPHRPDAETPPGQRLETARRAGPPAHPEAEQRQRRNDQDEEQVLQHVRAEEVALGELSDGRREREEQGDEGEPEGGVARGRRAEALRTAASSREDDRGDDAEAEGQRVGPPAAQEELGGGHAPLPLLCRLMLPSGRRS